MNSPTAAHGSRHAVGLGDLLRALHATQPGEWPWVAAAHGWPAAAQAELARAALARHDARPPNPGATRIAGHPRRRQHRRRNRHRRRQRSSGRSRRSGASHPI
jgi:hypothetical protein